MLDQKVPDERADGVYFKGSASGTLMMPELSQLSSHSFPGFSQKKKEEEEKRLLPAYLDSFRSAFGSWLLLQTCAPDLWQRGAGRHVMCTFAVSPGTHHTPSRTEGVFSRRGSLSGPEGTDRHRLCSSSQPEPLEAAGRGSPQRA